MSRIGKIPVPIPAGVTVTVDGPPVKVKGPKGELSRQPRRRASRPRWTAARSSSRAPATSSRTVPATASTARSCKGMVEGVSTGFEKRLEIVGVSYQAKLAGKSLSLQVGFCNPVVREIPKGLTVEVPTPTLIVIKGYDKQVVGQFAAELRSVAPARALQGQGRPLRRRGRRPEGRQVLRGRGEVSRDDCRSSWPSAA